MTLAKKKCVSNNPQLHGIGIISQRPCDMEPTRKFRPWNSTLVPRKRIEHCWAEDTESTLSMSKYGLICTSPSSQFSESQRVKRVERTHTFSHEWICSSEGQELVHNGTTPKKPLECGMLRLLCQSRVDIHRAAEFRGTTNVGA